MEIALSVVADSRHAVAEGLPRLLDLFSAQRIHATLFLNFGEPAPDVRPRLLPPPAPAKKGLFARLFPAPGIPTNEPPFPELVTDLAKRAIADGHEVGLRPLAPAQWRETLAGPGTDPLNENVLGAAHRFEAALGEPVASFSAPLWRVSPSLFALEEERGFAYASDTRGTGPFLPTLGERRFRCLQVPTTLPTWDEILGSPGLDDDSLLAFYRSSAREGIAQVHRIHAEIEGISHAPLFERLLAAWRADGIRFVRLDTVAARARSRKETLKFRAVLDREIPGHDGLVACEG